MGEKCSKEASELEGKVGVVSTLPPFTKPFQGVSRLTGKQWLQAAKSLSAQTPQVPWGWRLTATPLGSPSSICLPASHGQPTPITGAPRQWKLSCPYRRRASDPPLPSWSCPSVKGGIRQGYGAQALGATWLVPPSRAPRTVITHSSLLGWLGTASSSLPPQAATQPLRPFVLSHPPPHSWWPCQSRSSFNTTVSPHRRTPVQPQRGAAYGSLQSRTRGQRIGCV